MSTILKVLIGGVCVYGAQCRTCGHEPEHHRQTELIRYAGRTALPVGRAECLALQPFPSRKPCLCPGYKAPAAELVG